jgi:2-iminobutanoate/2-iminopropanoate deaminase
MDKKAVSTDRAPAAVGPYSQAIVANGLVFASGQIGLDPKTGALVDDDVVAQAEQVLENLAAVLSAAGSDLNQVVKATVYLADIADFKRVNDVYARHFADGAPPARAAFQVAALPLNARVEIEAIALAG